MKKLDVQEIYRGHYNVGLSSGIIAAGLAANAELLQFRNSMASKAAVIKKITMSAAVSTTFFAAGVPMQLDLKRAKSWTVAGTGGATPSLAALNKNQLDMPDSLMVNGDIRVATTAGLGAGTKTLEANSLKSLVASCPITASLEGTIVRPGTVIYDANINKHDGYPLVLAPNEGLSLLGVAVPATGTWQFSVNIEWAEMTLIG